MALFSFQRRHDFIAVSHFLLHLIGLLSILPALTTLKQVHAVANVPISEPDLKFELLPSSNRIIPQNNGSELLPCLVSMRNDTVYSSADFEYPFHIWLRNNQPIIAPRKNEFQIFKNGTLKILSGEKAPGSYRCLVNGTEIEAGILLSNETIVQSAVFKRLPTPSDLNITATIGQPIVIKCSILSVPKANITWFFGNKNTNTIGNRFLTLDNGGLLITNVTRADHGKFKCSARNSFASKHRHIVWSLSVQEDAHESRKRKGLLYRLQNETIYVEVGKSLRLFCASYSDRIDWWFSPREYANNSILVKNDSVELLVERTTVQKNDGWYKCSTKSDSQVFNVIIKTPPRITAPLENWKSSVSAQVSFNCHATGNPPPSIIWYRNGIRLENEFRIHYSSNALHINSIDLDEGIYQCFAKNIMGETFSSGRLILRRKDELPNMPKRPENVSCFAVNYETVYVTFSGVTSISFITPHMVTKDPFNWKTVMPISLTSTSKFKMVHVPVFKPFMLFLRGMVPTSTQKTVNGELHTFDTSLLSDGANCSTQGMRVNTVFLQAGIFIFWTPMDVVKAKYFRIQFSNNNSKNALVFGDTIVGTTHSIDLQRNTKEDITAWLFKMPVLVKTISTDELGETRTKRSIKGGGSAAGGKQNFENIEKREKLNKETMAGGTAFTEIRLPGNVTGVLIPNVQNIEVRVLIVTHDNENIIQDLRYVEWETISLESSAMEQTTMFSSNHHLLFSIASIESRSITISWNPAKSISCIKVCYFINMLEAKIRQNSHNTCQDIYEIEMYFTIRKLSPSTIYHMNFIDCTSTNQYGMVDVKTLPDAPGPITNQKVVKDDGFLLSWDSPINPNGEILYYNIKWTMHNSTFSANVTEGTNIFKLPNVTQENKINITIRAIGSSGEGLPIYMDLKDVMTVNFDKDGFQSFSDRILGIIVGIILSLLCILIFIWIFVKQRKRFKSHGCGQGNVTSPTDSNCPQTPGLNFELREMQTLIPKSTGLHIVGDGSMIALPRNGTYYDRNDEETVTAENVRDASKAICTSTPKASGRFENCSSLSERLLDEHGTISATNQSPPTVIVPITTVGLSDSHPTKTTAAVLSTTTKNEPITATTLLSDKNSSSSNFYTSNGNSSKLLNGSIKTTLPPNKHSIQAATSEPKLHKGNGSLKTANSLQYSIDPNSNTSTLDNSRHKLLDSKLDSRSTKSQLNDTKNHRNNNHRPLSQHYQQQPTVNCPLEKPLTNNHLPHDVALNDSDGDTTTTTIDLNDSIRNINSSNGSCTPLLKSSSWNYRRPIVEPNG